ncbi:hypothetical protein TNCV_3491941 [Trichonephila clavipes]|nr:hypothetical protein TNCV_3491941 [Trichonephila clavipes]
MNFHDAENRQCVAMSYDYMACKRVCSYSVCLAWVLTAKLNPSTSSHRQRSGVSIWGGNWASKLPAAIDLELEVNEDDIEGLIMGHEDELTTELQEIWNEEHQETQRNVSLLNKRKTKEDQCRHLPLKIF